MIVAASSSNPNNDRHGLLACQLTGSVPPVSGYQLITASGVRSSNRRSPQTPYRSISALLDGTTDIAMASRPIKFSEKMKVKSAGKEVEEVIVAYDALAVVVHPSNPVKQLTRQQLEDIFRGKITNWKQVGGDDRKIVVYSRETSSGTYEFFKESVLKNKNYMSSSLSMPATGAIIQSVSQTKGAIGYVGLAYLSPSRQVTFRIL